MYNEENVEVALGREKDILATEYTLQSIMSTLQSIEMSLRNIEKEVCKNQNDYNYGNISLIQ